jgi:hypothetical protein
VARVGRNHIVGSLTSTGLTVVGGEVVSAPAASNQTGRIEVSITSPVSSETLQPGDNIIAGLFRSAALAEDTCTSPMVLQGMVVTY